MITINITSLPKYTVLCFGQRAVTEKHKFFKLFAVFGQLEVMAEVSQYPLCRHSRVEYIL